VRTNARGISASYAIATLVLAALAAFAFGPCREHVRGKQPGAPRPMAAGETLGKADASSGADVAARTLLSVTCRDGQLVVRTNLDAISAADDCTQPIPQAALDRFIGLPVIITYTGERLVIENVAAGIKLELTAKDAAIGAIDGTP
jgi:hypothetical protein